MKESAWNLFLFVMVAGMAANFILAIINLVDWISR